MKFMHIKHGSFTESGLYVPEDGNIDLSPVIREYLMLSKVRSNQFVNLIARGYVSNAAKT